MTKETELKAWEEWKKKPGLTTNKNLFEAVKPRIDFIVHKYSRSGLSKPVLELEAKKLVLYQAKSFDPKKGVNFSTHVSQGFRKMNDVVEDSRHVVRIPNYLRQQVPNYLTVRDDLWNNLSRPPSIKEMADKLKIGFSLAGKLEGLVNMKEVGETSSSMEHFTAHTKSKEEDVIRSFYFDLKNDEERVIYEYTFGIHGKTKKKPKEIAKLIGWKEPKVRYFQNKVGKQMAEYSGR